MNHDDFHDELTAHLAAQEHPLPHPKGYAFGYVHRDKVIPMAPRRSITHPGPITMQEPKTKRKRSGFDPAAAMIWMALAAVIGWVLWLTCLTRTAK